MKKLWYFRFYLENGGPFTHSLANDSHWLMSKFGDIFILMKIISKTKWKRHLRKQIVILKHSDSFNDKEHAVHILDHRSNTASNHYEWL